MLTKAQLRALKLMLDSGDKEIVCDGGLCYIDTERISKGTVMALLRHMAIKDAGYGGGMETYIPACEAEHILKRPALADEMVARVVAQKPFSVDADGQIEDI